MFYALNIYYFYSFLKTAMFFSYVPYILEKLALKNLAVSHIYIKTNSVNANQVSYPFSLLDMFSCPTDLTGHI